MRIISNGSALTTKVLDNDGNDITKDLEVSKIEIEITATGKTKAILHCWPAEIDIIAEDENILKRKIIL